MDHIDILKETRSGKLGGWQLCYQWCIYIYNDRESKPGYRFVWRRPDDSIQVDQGQARIPSAAVAKQLMEQAGREGWGDYDGEAICNAARELEKEGYVVNLAVGYVGWPRGEEPKLKGNAIQIMNQACLITKSLL